MQTTTARTTHLMIVPPSSVPDLLSGRRTVEPRLGRDRRAPYGRVCPGDEVFIMATGGTVFGVCTVERVDEFEGLEPTDIDRLRDSYEARVHAGEDFWASKQDASFATMVWLGAIRPVRDASRIPQELTAPSRHSWRSASPGGEAAPLRAA
jgi:hypothetical protein